MKRFDLQSVAEMVDNDGYPSALVKAVVIRLISDAEYLEEDCEYRTRSRVPVHL